MKTSICLILTAMLWSAVGIQKVGAGNVTYIYYFGRPDAVPASGDYDGDGISDMTLYGSDGCWHSRLSSTGEEKNSWLGGRGAASAPADYDGDGTTDPAVYWPGECFWQISCSRYGAVGKQFGLPAASAMPGDYDGDGYDDLAVYKNGVWSGYSLYNEASLGTRAFATETVIPVPADYDGDSITDFACFRPSTGQWDLRWRDPFTFGRNGDVPVPGDYDGDGAGEVAVFRDATGLWAVRGVTRVYYGKAGDKPVGGDFNGDGTGDLGIFRGSTGLWAIRGITRAYYGIGSDSPIPFDCEGDGKVEIAVFREKSGLWAVRGVTRVYYGKAGDRPVPGDYLGNAAAEIAVFRGDTGLWAARNSARIYYGVQGDIPVPGKYTGSGKLSPTIFRPGAGLWCVKDFIRIYFGASGDTALPVDYDGDGKMDLAVHHGAAGNWDIHYFGGGDPALGVSFGDKDAVPCPADHDGDGRHDLAVYNPSSGVISVLQSRENDQVEHALRAGAVPAPGMYARPGEVNPAVYDGENGTWHVSYNSSPPETVGLIPFISCMVGLKKGIEEFPPWPAPVPIPAASWENFERAGIDLAFWFKVIGAAGNIASIIKTPTDIFAALAGDVLQMEMNDKLDHIAGELNAISDQLSDVAKTLSKQIHDTALQTEFDIMEGDHEHYIDDIDRYYKDFIYNKFANVTYYYSTTVAMRQYDVKEFCDEILRSGGTYRNNLNRIYRDLCSDSPCGIKAKTDLLQPKDGVWGSGVLMDAYLLLEQWFCQYLNKQAEGLLVLVEAELANDPTPEITDSDRVFSAQMDYSKFQSDIQEEVEIFLQCVDRLVVSSANVATDLTSPVVFLPDEAAEVYRRADFIAAVCSDDYSPGLVVRLIGEPDTIQNYIDNGYPKISDGTRFLSLEHQDTYYYKNIDWDFQNQTMYSARYGKTKKYLQFRSVSPVQQEFSVQPADSIAVARFILPDPALGEYTVTLPSNGWTDGEEIAHELEVDSYYYDFTPYGNWPPPSELAPVVMKYGHLLVPVRHTPEAVCRLDNYDFPDWDVYWRARPIVYISSTDSQKCKISTSGISSGFIDCTGQGPQSIDWTSVKSVRLHPLSWGWRLGSGVSTEMNVEVNGDQPLLDLQCTLVQKWLHFNNDFPLIDYCIQKYWWPPANWKKESIYGVSDHPNPDNSESRFDDLQYDVSIDIPSVYFVDLGVENKTHFNFYFNIIPTPLLIPFTLWPKNEKFSQTIIDKHFILYVHQ